MLNRYVRQREHGGMIAAAVIASIVILAGVGWIVYSWLNAEPPAPPAEGDVGIRGVTLCLPHKDTSGPQTMECAYGLKDKDGQYYAIRDLDPTYKNISSLAMNSEVTLVGNFRAETNETYPIVGTIEISEIKY